MDLDTLSSSLGNERLSVQALAEKAFSSIYIQLSDETHPLTLDLAPCGLDTIAQLRKSADPLYASGEAHRILTNLEKRSEESIKYEARTQKHVSLHTRRLFTDCRLLHSLLDLRDRARLADEVWLHAIRRLDMAVIIAGAPGESRLDLILETIELIQRRCLSLATLPVETSVTPDKTNSIGLPIFVESITSKPIPRISPPSISTFCSSFSSEPFILTGYISDWPALNDHPWHSCRYLQRISGRGRIVPVEVGPDYRAEDWGQKLIPWEDFLRGIGMGPHMEYSVDAATHTHTGESRLKKEPLYLAQHTLLTQFPGLRSDIIVPDYVYASLSAPPAFPGYRPPGNEEQLVINAWLGPRGTVSPAHTDPYFNCYAQVVGRKTVWLAPPWCQEGMYPISNPHAPHIAREALDNPARNEEMGSTASPLGNTSSVDVFMPSESVEFPLFEKLVRPHALCTVLEPGDLLYIPPGWWHAMRSEDISFSVSFWF